MPANTTKPPIIHLRPAHLGIELSSFSVIQPSNCHTIETLLRAAPRGKLPQSHLPVNYSSGATPILTRNRSSSRSTFHFLEQVYPIRATAPACSYVPTRPHASLDPASRKLPMPTRFTVTPRPSPGLRRDARSPASVVPASVIPDHDHAPVRCRSSVQFRSSVILPKLPKWRTLREAVFSWFLCVLCAFFLCVRSLR